MLVRKDIPRTCSLCQHASALSETEFLCHRQGVVGANFKCRKFKYDPTRRVPTPKLKVPSQLDFKIDD